MSERAETHLSLIVPGPALRSFCLLTGSGFKVNIKLPCNLREFLCGPLGVEPEYLEARIQTMFLNSRAVDDPTTAIVTAGSTIGLSGAMPGIAGAMLRKGSRLKSMRKPISHGTLGSEPPPEQAGQVTVRLFNVLQEELGPSLLERGIHVAGESFADLLRRQSKPLHSVVRAAERNGETVPVSALCATDWTDRELHLQVRTCSSPTTAISP